MLDERWMHLTPQICDAVLGSDRDRVTREGWGVWSDKKGQQDRLDVAIVRTAQQRQRRLLETPGTQSRDLTVPTGPDAANIVAYIHRMTSPS
ncbi:unnamed protein product [Parajaminaea phylloscopi]